MVTTCSLKYLKCLCFLAAYCEEFVLRQLRTTANLRLANPVVRLLDFLMHGPQFSFHSVQKYELVFFSFLRFHGDSLQAGWILRAGDCWKSVSCGGGTSPVASYELHPFARSLPGSKERMQGVSWQTWDW